MALHKIPYFAAPLFFINRRIAAHKAAGRLLEGLQYDKVGRVRTIGDQDLPLLTFRSVSHTSMIAPGAVSNAQKTSGLNGVINETMTIRFELRTKQDKGFVSESYVDGAVIKGHVDWVARILDAIELKENGTDVDAGLENMASKPIHFNVLEPEETDLSTTSVIEVVLETHPRCRSQRMAKVEVNLS